MTKREAAIISAYTDTLMCDFSGLHKYIEEIMGRTVFTHEFSGLKEEIHKRSKADFLAICEAVEV